MILKISDTEDFIVAHHLIGVRSPCKYITNNSQLPLRWTHSGPALTVRLREVSTLEGDEVND